MRAEWMPWKCMEWRMRAVVLEDDAKAVAFGRAQGGTRYPAVVGPGRKEDARRDLDLLVLADDLEGPQRAAVRQGRDDPGLPVGQERRGVEAVRALPTSPTVIMLPWAP